MNPQKQLFRQPIRTLVMLLLLSVASAFLCLGFGVLSSAKETAQAIDDKFVTIALPANGGHTDEPYTASWGMAQKTPDYMKVLMSSSPTVKSCNYQHFVSGYSPSLFPTTSAREDGKYSQSLDGPYNSAVLLVTLTDIREPEDSSATYPYLILTAAVDEVLAMHGDYEIRDRIEISYTYFSQEELESAQLQVGRKYLIYGTDYRDFDLEIRTELANFYGCELEKITWDYTDVQDVIIDGKITKSYVYAPPGRGSQLIHNAEYINTGWLSVCNQGAEPMYQEVYIDKITGETFEERLGELLETPTIQYMSPKFYNDLDAFLSSAIGAEWQKIITQVEISNQSVPVFGTDSLEAMYQFHENWAFIVQGRSISAEDYIQGNQVCVISETLATSSGLTVGDTIDLSFYWGANWVTDMLNNYLRNWGGNTASHPYNRKVGFSEQGMKFEIIGIYRQEDLWAQCSYEWSKGEMLRTNPYVFTPNTVFVPNKAIETVPTYTEESDLFFTLVLKNGTIEATQDFLKSNGYSGSELLIFDNGYSELADTLNSFRESAGQLFLASVLTWLAAAVVYLALFVLRQRRNAGLMVSLGSGRRKATGFVWTISMLPVLAASAVGALVGMALMNGTLEKVFASVQDVLSSDFSSTAGGHISVESTLVALPWTAALAALGQGLIFAALIWLCAAAITRRKPLDNLKGT